jgi:alkanesulfonate monooxygenase SsuD/methylene tetrahydromethanopterin reductase-like flavin-dependent oxidoreductase (luciferase family)
MFAYLAGITQRIELVCGVLILPQRQTVLVARQSADLDLLSGGRFRLGVGLGWNYVEYDALGQDFKRRGRRASEQVPLLRRLWTEPLVTFEGEFDHLDRVSLNPRPAHPIPIWFGGFSEPAYRRPAERRRILARKWSSGARTRPRSRWPTEFAGAASGAARTSPLIRWARDLRLPRRTSTS